MIADPIRYIKNAKMSRRSVQYRQTISMLNEEFIMREVLPFREESQSGAYLVW